jgi:hypothetical protein
MSVLIFCVHQEGVDDAINERNHGDVSERLTHFNVPFTEVHKCFLIVDEAYSYQTLVEMLCKEYNQTKYLMGAEILL